jgi:hypothetical protein
LIFRHTGELRAGSDQYFSTSNSRSCKSGSSHIVFDQQFVVCTIFKYYNNPIFSGDIDLSIAYDREGEIFTSVLNASLATS